MGRSNDVSRAFLVPLRVLVSMMESLIAQLHLSDRVSAQPHGADSYGPVEGTNVDLGPKGMYVSLGFEDLETLMGWVELRGGGAHVTDPRRTGLGFQ